MNDGKIGDHLRSWVDLVNGQLPDYGMMII
jgi:hypothetical protein